MKLNFMCLCVLLGVSRLAQSEVTNSPWSPNITLRSVVANQFLAFASGVTLYNKPVVQTDLFVSLNNGLYFDLWNSVGFERWNNNLGTEIDYGVGWFGKMPGLNDINVDVGITYFDEPSAPKIGANDIIFSHIRFSKDFKAFTLFAIYENYTTTPGSSFCLGHLPSIGATKNFCLIKDRLNLSTTGMFTYDTGGTGIDNGLLAKGTVLLDVVITKHLSLILPQVNWYCPITINDSRKVDAVVFAGACYKF